MLTDGPHKFTSLLGVTRFKAPRVVRVRIGMAWFFLNGGQFKSGRRRIGPADRAFLEQVALGLPGYDGRQHQRALKLQRRGLILRHKHSWRLTIAGYEFAKGNY